MIVTTATPPSHRLDLNHRSMAVQGLAVLVGTLALTASSHIQLPMIPVPMTMQTLAVTLLGALFGWRLGALAVLAWLVEGALGMPVFAGGAAGAAHLIGKTGGYLMAFPLAAALTGYLVERGWGANRLPLAFTAMLLGNALCLGMGCLWLATFIGMHKAVEFGVNPFLLGGLLKSVLGAAALKAIALERKAGD